MDPRIPGWSYVLTVGCISTNLLYLALCVIKDITEINPFLANWSMNIFEDQSYNTLKKKSKRYTSFPKLISPDMRQSYIFWPVFLVISKLRDWNKPQLKQLEEMDMSAVWNRSREADSRLHNQVGLDHKRGKESARQRWTLNQVTKQGFLFINC